MPSLDPIHARTLTGIIRGCAKGAAAGAAASIASGAAVIATAPAWLPFIGGTALVAGATITLWSALGGGIGSIVSGARAWRACKKEQEAFEQAFPAPAAIKTPEGEEKSPEQPHSTPKTIRSTER
jgi:hypothetical protein